MFGLNVYRGLVLVAVLLAVSTAGPALAQTGVQFDGTNDYVTFGTASSLGDSTFTLEVWFRRDGAGATTSTGTGGVTAVPLLTKGRGEADGDNRDMNWFLGIQATTNVLVVDYEEGAGQLSPGLNHPASGTTAIRNGTWYHAAATFDGTTWRLYLNGVLESTTVVGAGRYPRWDSIQRAALASALTSTGTAAGFFNGVIDEPRVWGRALSQTEIRNNMFLEVTSGTELLGRWGLNEGTGTTAGNSVVAGPAGTLTNGPTWTTGSPFALDNALKLGASSAYVTFGAAPELGLAQFTLETWFKRDGAGTAVSSGTGGVTLLPLVTKGAPQAEGGTVDANYILGIRSSDGVLAADFEEGTGGASPGLNHPVVGVTPVVNGTWYHAAATYDGSTWRLYLNGQLEAELFVGQPVQSASVQHAGLGSMLRTDGTPQGFFDGTLDEVRIWSGARTAGEIAATINSRLGGSVSGLVARWGLDEGAGTTVASTAGTALPGTITGSGWSWASPAPFNVAPPGPPADPTGLVATAESCYRILLSWTDNATNETGYRIERSTDGVGGPFTLAATLGPGFQSWADPNRAPYTEYCYRVYATNASGNSGPSNVDCETTPVEAEHAIDFGGTNAYVTFGDPTALDLAAFTIETWLRRDGAGTTANTGTGGMFAVPLVTKGVGEADNSNVDMNWFLGIDGTLGVIAADFEEGSGGSSPGLNHPVQGTTVLQTGTWYHAAATYDGTTWKLYLNGVLERSLTVGQPVQSASIQHAGLATALNSTGTASGYFDGVLDEVRIWNHARTEAQIRTTINDALSSPQTGLVARWSLNEGAASYVNGSAGTLVNGPVQGAAWAWTTPGAPFDIVVNEPPNAPVLVSPPDLATGVGLSPTLSVAVTDAEAESLTVTFYGRPVSTSAGPDFTFVMLPDTQYYTAESNGATVAILQSQLDWIAEARDSLNIVFVSHVGDLTDHGDAAPVEFERAGTAFATLEDSLLTGLPEGIPYHIAVGNHDQLPNGDAAGTTSGYNLHFGESRFAGRPWYGGHYGTNNDNHAVVFSVSGLDFVLVSLEYDTSPDAAVLAWADSVLAAHPLRKGIVTGHNLINTGNPGSWSSQGSTIYNALKDNPNLFLMLCGHVPGEGRRTDTFGGSTVHTILADYQSRTAGGNGWLRILKFSPSAGTIDVETYSPWLNQFETDTDSRFTLAAELIPVEDWQVIGTARVASGETASVAWPGRSPLTGYEWYAAVSDGNTTVTGPTWSFTTGEAPDAVAPSVTVGVPNGGETLTVGASTNLTWTATDNVGVTEVDLLLSRDGAAGTFETIATGIANSGSYPWTVTGPPTANAFLKVVARDAMLNEGNDLSDAAFAIQDDITGFEEALPAAFALGPIAPNPLRSGTSIAFALPLESTVRLSVLDVSGREIAVLRSGTAPAGYHRATWNGDGAHGPVGSGVYFIRLRTASHTMTEKVVLLR